MKRRHFLKSIAPIAIPAVIPGISIHAFRSNPFLKSLPFVNTDRILVMIQWSGGCDGLNTVIPIDQYGALANARTNIILPQSSILGLTGSIATGLHPAMPEIRDMYNNGHISIIQSVAYANQNFSHFRSTDIWMTGSDADELLTTGWGGRYLDYEFPNAPTAYPSESMPDPLAIQIGNSVSQVFWGANGVLGYSLENTTSFYNLVNGTTDPTTNTYFGDELTYLREVSRSANAYASSISNASNSVSSQFTGYPSNNTLADHLKIVARLIKGGLKTRMYLVNLGGFDTHSSQVNTDNLTGSHPNLLSLFSKAVKAFHDDLKFLNIDHRVVGMTFSEFGRRIKSNSSRGTDHGLASPMFAFGTNIKGGIIGTSPMIPAAATSSDNVAMQFDYRQVYSTLLKDWFCAPAVETNSILPDAWTTLPLIHSTAANICNPIALAINEIKLEVEILKNGDHSINWDMRNEKSVLYYLIQHSPDGSNFYDLTKVFTNGNQSYLAEYQFLQTPTNDRFHYYRIKAVLPDDKMMYSNVVKKLASISLSIYPVPAVNYINIKINRLEEETMYHIRLIAPDGRIVWQNQVKGQEFSASIYRISVSTLITGTYVLQLRNQYDLNYSQRVQIVN